MSERPQCLGCLEPADLIDLDYDEHWCWACKKELDSNKSPDEHINNYKVIHAVTEGDANQITERR